MRTFCLKHAKQRLQTRWCCSSNAIMGQVMSYGLTQDDVEEVISYCGGLYTHQEISALYRRFRTLDRGRKGYITADEFMTIPELSINPLAQRLIRMFDGVNFIEFCRLLMPFSSKASQEIKVQAIFHVFDVDGDDEEMDALIEKVFSEAGVEDGLPSALFTSVFSDSELNMTVEMPVYMSSM